MVERELMDTLFSGSGDMNCGHGIDIAGSGHPDHLILHGSGNVNLYLKFGTPTPEVLNLIVYTEFQNHLEIDAWYATYLKVLVGS